MNQSFEAQVRMAARALRDVIAPALDGAEKHVVEQLHLVMATLDFVATRLPDGGRHARMELASYLALAANAEAIVRADLPGEADALRADIALGDAAFAASESDAADCQAATRRLREQISALAASAVGLPSQGALNAEILGRSAPILAQSRLWSAPFGFELDPDELPSPAW